MTVALEKLGKDERIRIAESLFEVTRHAGSDGEIHGLCPLHGEKNPSFSYNIVKDTYHCFSCGLAGDLADLWIRVNGGTFRDFLRENGIAGEGTSESSKYRAPRVTSAKPAKPARPPAPSTAPAAPHAAAGASDNGVADPDLWQQRAAALVDHAEKALLDNKFIIGWLKKRGISKKTAIGMRLGWLAEDRYRPRERWGLSPVLKDNGKFKKLWIPAGLVIPLIESRGEAAAFVRRIRIRRFADTEPKYVVLPGPSAGCMTYGLPTRAAVIVENWLDGIMLASQVGEFCAVVALGSASAKPDHALASMLSACAVLLVALDFGDDKHAGAKAWTWWRETFPRAKRWPVPSGKDAGEAFAAGHSMTVWIRSGLPPAWFFGPNLDGMITSRGGASDRQAEHPVAAAETKVSSGETNHADDETTAAAGNPGAGVESNLPAAVAELAGLLRRYPVEIRVAPDDSRVLVRENVNWARKNWDTSRRISELVFKPDVLKHLWSLGVEVVNGKNVIGVN